MFEEFEAIDNICVSRMVSKRERVLNDLVVPVHGEIIYLNMTQ